VELPYLSLLLLLPSPEPGKNSLYYPFVFLLLSYSLVLLKPEPFDSLLCLTKAIPSPGAYTLFNARWFRGRIGRGAKAHIR